MPHLARRTKPYLVAEFGLNHNRDIELAFSMAEAAKIAGVDAVKLQSYTTEQFIHTQFENTRGLFEIFKQFETDLDFHQKLQSKCTSLDLDFFSTPLTCDWVTTLDQLNVPFFKVASGDVNNWQLLRAIAQTQKPMIISTGAAVESELIRLRSFLHEAKVNDFSILHCVSLYPTPLAKVNLRRMIHLQQLFEDICVEPVDKSSLCPRSFSAVGFSDHTIGTDASFAAVALGAKIIEKHFTLDKRLPGPDQSMSADPSEIKALRHAVDTAFELVATRENPLDCDVDELKSDYFGKRSLYEVDGKLIAMRPRHPDFKSAADY